MQRKLSFSLLFCAALWLTCSAAAQVSTWDAARDFSGSQNPNAQWTYAWATTGSSTATPFSAYQAAVPAYPTRDAWQDLSQGNLLGVYHNAVGVTGDIPTNMLLLQPDPLLGKVAVLEWTAPTNMSVHVQGTFRSLDATAGQVSIVSSVSGTRFSTTVPSGGADASFGLFLNVTAGEKIDFISSAGAAGVNAVVSQLSLAGNSAVLSVSATDTRFRVTNNAASQAGAGWTAAQQRLSDGFDTDFSFQISQLTGTGADGFALVFQNASATALGGAGGALGYAGVTSSLAIEFDSYANSDFGDPNSNHISVHTLGIQPNSALESASIGRTSSIPNLKDGNWHFVHVHYAVQPQPQLSIYLDNTTTPVLQLSVDLVATLQLGQQSAWVGFTGGTGGLTENHDIRNWHFQSLDLHGPQLTLPSDVTVEGAVRGGAIVNFSASALDAVDGPRPATCDAQSGQVFPVGQTTVHCSATDLSGNRTDGSFAVTVTDTTAPMLNLPTSVTATALSHSGAPVDYVAGATDLVDGDVVPQCTPASGSTFPAGETTVSCRATDRAGNLASGTFTVNVKDNRAPVISGAADLVAEATGTLTAVAWPGVTANDDIDGAVPVTCMPASGTAFPLGSTNVSCSAADAQSNQSSVAFTVRVQDTIAPVIAIAASTTYTLHQPVTTSYSCTDSGSGVATCAGPSASGAALDTSSAGVQTFTVNATDNAGNTSSLSVSYSVAYNLCVLSSGNAKQSGSTIPVRVALCDYEGKNVSSAAVDVMAVAVAGPDGPRRVASAGNANPNQRFHFLADGAYIFNLNTAGLRPGAYALLVRVAGDPTPHSVPFAVSGRK